MWILVSEWMNDRLALFTYMSVRGWSYLEYVIATFIIIILLLYSVIKYSIVYNCPLDATKTFDRLHFGRLFKRRILISLIRILFKKSRVVWGTYESEYFCMYNGAKQGAITYPFYSLFIFWLFIDLIETFMYWLSHWQLIYGCLSICRWYNFIMP